MHKVDLAIFGSGLLARSLVLTLSACVRDTMSILMVGRNEVSLQRIALLARARSAALGSQLLVQVEHCDYTHEQLRRLFSRLGASAIVMLASKQSPWTMGSRWRALIGFAGYGLTLSLQACLADRVFRVARESLPDAVLVNGCYPDLVNRLLADRGTSVACGIGNIAIIDSVLRSQYPGDEIRLVAHHAHVAALMKGRWDGLAPPLVWQNGKRWLDDAGANLIAHLSLPSDSSLNEVTSASAIPLLLALIGRDSPWKGHAPGVAGLLGGLPVKVSYRSVEIDVPPGTSLEEMCSLNEVYGISDGVIVDERGVYRLAKSAEEIEAACGVRVPKDLLQWTADDLDQYAQSLEMFRDSIDSCS